MRLLVTFARRIHKRPLYTPTSCLSSAASCSGAATNSGLQFRDDQLVCGSTGELVQRLRGQVEAIHGYRETERAQWGAVCEGVMDRLRAVAFSEGSPLLGPVHVLDLDKAGYIKPHIDSVKFCGSTIAGLSLLSDSVMRLVREDEPAEWLNLFLPRRSLYILRDQARYKFTHEILKDDESLFSGQRVPRHRRISVICRNLPV
ncbi:alpha-ketoglutarate-dependent dioxygenase alkB homolog 7, mitochondrial isoform X1 [Oncorhynchus mykiss]|uniref:alpha-ketoglutarate-dependent dioxygenase alkB homolog 7, mitochondrial isoform X1 n=1 Tax=Oncorhynchus mykiss TaxID=8022 RepID=UPI000B4F6CA6|nr:alpha-ketoglutarate-dependent dioxygenase alkB homolog 7, mitochondrial isoform X1 [Oncorhynchus mykiss]